MELGCSKVLWKIALSDLACLAVGELSVRELDPFTFSALRWKRAEMGWSAALVAQLFYSMR